MLKPNNILSYFIKDIKDTNERAFYKQINNIDCIRILYKDKIIYEYGRYYISNYLSNISKSFNKANSLAYSSNLSFILTILFLLDI